MKTRNQNAGIVFLWAISTAAFLTGCSEKAENGTPSNAGTNASTNRMSATNADNSGINARDRNNANLTPVDQGNSPTDRKITQEIRQALVVGANYMAGTNFTGGTNNSVGMANMNTNRAQGFWERTNEFSMTAENVKIITVDGRVTLRGPVNTPSEKTEIEAIAKEVAGPTNVNDELEVKAN